MYWFDSLRYLVKWIKSLSLKTVQLKLLFSSSKFKSSWGLLFAGWNLGSVGETELMTDMGWALVKFEARCPQLMVWLMVGRTRYQLIVFCAYNGLLREGRIWCTLRLSRPVRFRSVWGSFCIVCRIKRNLLWSFPR